MKLSRLAIVFSVFCFSFFAFLSSARASETEGTVDSTNKYAKVLADDSQINFGTANSTVEITDDGITGYAWAEHYGWINMAPSNGGITIADDGTLSGYAWGETMGWINFSPTNGGVTISEDGEFGGYAWSENAGWINFDCTDPDACLSTDFVPADHRPAPASGGAVSSPAPSAPAPVTPAPTTPVPTTPVPTTPPAPAPTTPAPAEPTPAVPDPTPAVSEPETPVSPVPVPPAPEAPAPAPLIPISDFVSDNFPGVSDAVDRVARQFGDSFRQLGQETTRALEVSSIVIAETKKEVAAVVDTPTGDVVTKTVATTGIVAGASATVASAFFLNPLSVSEIALLPVRLWALLMSALGIRKRHRPWGTVYDSVTKQPLDPAYVVLQDANGNEVTTSITDLDGRYGFLAEGGAYKIVANKTNYAFPSQKLAGRTRDEIYGDLYFGEALQLAPGEVVTKNIPLDPLKFDWNEFAKNEQKLMKFHSKRNLILAKVSEIAFVLGFIVAVISIYVVPKPYNAVIFFLYILLLIVRRFGAKAKTRGTVVDADGNPLSFGVIHVYSAGTNTEIMKKIADKTGRFYALLPQGRFYLKIDRKNADESYSHAYTTPIMDLKKGVLAERIRIPAGYVPEVPPKNPEPPAATMPQPSAPHAQPPVSSPEQPISAAAPGGSPAPETHPAQEGTVRMISQDDMLK